MELSDATASHLPGCRFDSHYDLEGSGPASTTGPVGVKDLCEKGTDPVMPHILFVRIYKEGYGLGDGAGWGCVRLIVHIHGEGKSIA